ncbi:FdtA/QdtA family cupin domain-containing protein [Pseudoroseicyclus sp. CXY001]|uniref:sugar 3,4-ketoisomerase n=1 Tax=Pseudoroseicyclus sp. CXY001 TaxID=3242492 RepID=UPI0035716813
MGLETCRFVEIPAVVDTRGSIAIVEGGRDVPFEIARVYLTFDIPSGARRAGHAHRRLWQLYIAASGAFDIRLADGAAERLVTLRHPREALLLGPGVWREIENFSANAGLLVLASEHYDEADYVRDRAEFERLAAAGGPW